MILVFQKPLDNPLWAKQVQPKEAQLKSCKLRYIKETI